MKGFLRERQGDIMFYGFLVLIVFLVIGAVAIGQRAFVKKEPVETVTEIVALKDGEVYAFHVCLNDTDTCFRYYSKEPKLTVMFQDKPTVVKETQETRWHMGFLKTLGGYYEGK